MSSSGSVVDYTFRVPLASSIYPRPTFKETLPILHEINESQPPSKRLPTELLLQVNYEVHRNTLYENIRSTWMPILDWDEVRSEDGGWMSVHHYTYDSPHESLSLVKATLDLETKRYHIDATSSMENFVENGSAHNKNLIASLRDHISCADLLYRLRCFFPELLVCSLGPNGFDKFWEAGVRHTHTGLGLKFSDNDGAVVLLLDLDGRTKCRSGKHREEDITQDMLEDFSADCVRLINAFFETEAGSSRLAYFHPAADADAPSINQRYIAVPPRTVRDHIEKDPEPYTIWDPVYVSVRDMSSFYSLLPDLRYNVEARKIDPVNGTTCITNIIPSSLLFYRLLFQFELVEHRNATVRRKGKQYPSITSVWQIELTHYETEAPIIFMDNRGLFDIRVDKYAEEVMEDIIEMINSLCNDD